MNRLEMEKLLLEASAVDNRTVNDYMVEAWLGAIGSYTYEDAVVALREFRKVATEEYLVPGHITLHIRIKRERHRELYGMHTTPPPPGKQWAVDVIEYDPKFALPAIEPGRRSVDQSN